MCFSDFIKPCRIILHISNWCRKRRSKNDSTYVMPQSICQSQSVWRPPRNQSDQRRRHCATAIQLDNLRQNGVIHSFETSRWILQALLWFHVGQCISDEETLPCWRLEHIFASTWHATWSKRLEFCRPSSSLIPITLGRSSSVNWKPLAKARHGGWWHGTGTG